MAVLPVVVTVHVYIIGDYYVHYVLNFACTRLGAFGIIVPKIMKSFLFFLKTLFIKDTESLWVKRKASIAVFRDNLFPCPTQ